MKYVHVFIRMFLPNIIISFMFLPLLWALYGSETTLMMFLVGLVAGTGFTFGAFVGIQWSNNWFATHQSKKDMEG